MLVGLWIDTQGLDALAQQAAHFNRGCARGLFPCEILVGVVGGFDTGLLHAEQAHDIRPGDEALQLSAL